jgi:methionyl-tRNA synthetase
MNETPAKVDRAMEELAFSEALGAILKLVSEANIYIEKQAPWTLAKRGETVRLELVLSTLFKILTLTANLIAPFMPQTVDRMLYQLNPGGKTRKADPLFPRLTKPTI